MNVGLVIYGTLDTVSGGYLYDRKLVAYLRQHGVQVDIISLPLSSYGRHLFHNLSTAYTQQLTTQYDILLQDELNHASLFWLNRKLKRKNHAPIISIVHHLRCMEQWGWGKRPFYRLIERMYLGSVDGFIFNSQTTKQTVAKLISPLPHHVVAFPAGDRFHPTITAAGITNRAQNGLFRILFVGNLIPRKGLHTLIIALAPLRRLGWRLDVVGNTAVSPRYMQQIRRRVEMAELTKQITFHGSLPDNELRTLYEISHCLAVPSQYEGFGIVYLEAMGFGLPTFATTNGAAHELITDGENGFLMGMEETAVITHHLQKLMQDRHALTRMSLAAYGRYQTHPTWTQSMEKIYTFLINFQSR
jgi:glycosyltransferase involved in cell wall biosynthesis